MTREEARNLLVMIEIKEPNEFIVNSWWGSFAKDYKEALQMAIEALEQEKKTRWIPVSERLPEDYGEYICTMSNDNVQECGFIPSGEKGLIQGWSTCEADGFKKLDYRDIKAWMPLPEPYKAESEGKE